MEDAKPVAVVFYIDGCNLYHGMRNAKQRRFYWLDLAALAREFLKEGQTLACVKYFTARVGDADKNKRHSTYIDALRTVGGVEIIEGHFQSEPFYCGRCHNRRPVPKEKQTDTNIATAMVIDAFRNRWDVAFVVSGDADLVPPIKGVRKEMPEKRVFVIHPPCRYSTELKQAANHIFHLNEAMLARCQLDDTVQNGTFALKRPEKWREE
jgi:uncharacterized LabA/DUF88 family protein